MFLLGQEFASMVLETQKSHPCRSAFGIQMQKYPPVKIKQKNIIQENIMFSEYMKCIFIYTFFGPNWCKIIWKQDNGIYGTDLPISRFFHAGLSKEIFGRNSR